MKGSWDSFTLFKNNTRGPQDSFSFEKRQKEFLRKRHEEILRFFHVFQKQNTRGPQDSFSFEEKTQRTVEILSHSSKNYWLEGLKILSHQKQTQGTPRFFHILSNINPQDSLTCFKKKTWRDPEILSRF